MAEGEKGVGAKEDDGKKAWVCSNIFPPGQAPIHVPEQYQRSRDTFTSIFTKMLAVMM